MMQLSRSFPTILLCSSYAILFQRRIARFLSFRFMMAVYTSWHGETLPRVQRCSLELKMKEYLPFLKRRAPVSYFPLSCLRSTSFHTLHRICHYPAKLPRHMFRITSGLYSVQVHHWTA